jgi:hypothetical protein
MKTSDGKPGLSWRVAILPYLNQEDLYKQFKLDEAWDSPDNLRLADRMPDVFGRGSGPFARQTQVKFFVGKGTIFDPDHPEMRRLSAIKDGPAKTILLVDAMPRVTWTQPDDVPFDPDAELPGMSSGMGETFNIAFADGTVKSIRRSVNRDNLKLWIMSNAGKEKPSLDD